MDLREIEKMEKEQPGSSLLHMLNQEAGKQPIIKAALKIRQSVNAIKKDATSKIMTKTEKDNFNHTLHQAAAQDLAELMTQVAKQQQRIIDKSKAEYEGFRKTHADRVRLNIADDQLKYSAMSQQELNAVSLEILEGKKDFSPEAVDVISHELKQTDPNSFKLVREAIKEYHYHEPYLRTPESRQAAEVIKQVDIAIRNGNSIPYKDPESGNFAGVSIADVVGWIE